MNSGMQVGETIGAYRVDRLGALDAHATHLVSGQSVRIRWVEPADPGPFVQAARRLCGVESPTLHALIDVGFAENGRCYLVDAPLHGESLADAIARSGPMRGDDLLAFAESMAAVLIELHARQAVDGALSPGRIRLVKGQTRLTEPGLGRYLPALHTGADFAHPTAGATAVGDRFAVAAIICFAANGRSLPHDKAVAATGLPAPIAELLTRSLAADGTLSNDSLLRTIEAVRAGTLGEPVEAPGAWLTDARVEADTGGRFNFTDVPDELPTAQSAGIGVPERSATPAPVRPIAQPKPAPVKRTMPSHASPPAPRSNGIVWILVLLTLAVGGFVAWQVLAPTPPLPDPAAALPSTAATPSVNGPTTDAPPSNTPPSVASAASAVSAAPATKDKYAFVTVLVSPGPARFVQVKSKTVLCEAAQRCAVPIDIDTRVEQDGYEPQVLSGDDLYDRRGHRWKVRLRSIEK